MENLLNSSHSEYEALKLHHIKIIYMGSWKQCQFLCIISIVVERKVVVAIYIFQFFIMVYIIYIMGYFSTLFDNLMGN